MKKSYKNQIYHLDVIEKLKESKIKDFSIQNLKTDYDEGILNLNPPYQRLNVWPLEFKKAWITSLWYECPVPPLTFVKDGNKYNMLDGKQRTTATIEFLNGVFSVDLPDIDEREVDRNFFENSQNKDIKNKWRRFKDYSLKVMVLPDTDVIQQRNIFLVINNSAPLVTNEKVYCDNFLTKQFIHELWNDTLKDYKSFSGKDIQHPHSIYKTYDNLRFLHSILGKLFGHQLRDVSSDQLTDSKSVNKGWIRTSAEELEEMLLKNHFKEDGVIDDEILKKLGIRSQIKSFKDVSKALKSVLEFNSISSKWTKNIIRDALCYFTDLSYRNKFTVSNIKENIELLHKILSDYGVTVAKMEHNGARSQDPKAIRRRIKTLDDIFNENINKTVKVIEIDEKNVLPSQSEITQAKLESNGKCPMPGCGRILTDENTRIDHVNCKSKFGKTKFVAICEPCNSAKGNLSVDQMEKYITYINNNQLDEV